VRIPLVLKKNLIHNGDNALNEYQCRIETLRC